MSKYYRVRTKVQWGWLMKWFEEQDENIKWSYNDKPTGGISDLLVGILLKRADIVVKLDNFTLRVGNVRNREVIGKKLIEVSQMMEDEKMEDYVAIKGEDLIKIKSSLDLESYIHELNIPKSLLYPKIQFTEAEKKEFDWLKGQNLDSLYRALDYIDEERSDYGTIPNLFEAIYANKTLSELDFIHAWVCPDLIEVLPEKKWNVRVPISNDEEFYKKDSTGKVGTVSFVEEHSLKLSDMQFTAEELKHYGLDNDLFEKVEVQE